MHPNRTTQHGSRTLKLGALAEVIAGYSEKDAKDRNRGELRLVQARDLDGSGAVCWQHLERCVAKPGAERARLQPGDLLLSVRSAEPRAILIDGPPEDAVAASTFAILRCRPEAVDLHFLHWLLEADSTRERLRGKLRGSTMPFLGIADLADFDVHVPPLSTQRIIARVHLLRRRLAGLAARHDRALGRLLEGTAHLTNS